MSGHNQLLPLGKIANIAGRALSSRRPLKGARPGGSDPTGPNFINDTRMSPMRRPYKPLSAQRGMPWPHPPGASPDVHASATPFTVEVRAVKGAIVYADDMPIPGDQFIHVELTPHIARAIADGDLEKRPRPARRKPPAKAAGTPVAATPAKRPTKQAAKKSAKKPARNAPKRAATPEQKSVKPAEQRTRISQMLINAAFDRLRPRHPKGFAQVSPTVLRSQAKPIWPEICAAAGVSPGDYLLPKWDSWKRGRDRAIARDQG